VESDWIFDFGISGFRDWSATDAGVSGNRKSRTHKIENYRLAAGKPKRDIGAQRRITSDIEHRTNIESRAVLKLTPPLRRICKIAPMISLALAILGWAECGALAAPAANPEKRETAAAGDAASARAADVQGQARSVVRRRIGMPQVLRVTPTSCEIEWSGPADSALHYTIQSLRLSVDEHRQLKVDWLPMPGVEIKETRKDDSTPGAGQIPTAQARAVIKNLQPGAAYALRVVAVNAGAEAVAESPQLQIRMPAKSHRTSTLLWALLVCAIAAIGFAVWRRSKT
jgi:fibronectin type III domain protein